MSDDQEQTDQNEAEHQTLVEVVASDPDGGGGCLGLVLAVAPLIVFLLTRG